MHCSRIRSWFSTAALALASLLLTMDGGRATAQTDEAPRPLNSVLKKPTTSDADDGAPTRAAAPVAENVPQDVPLGGVVTPKPSPTAADEPPAPKDSKTPTESVGQRVPGQSPADVPRYSLTSQADQDAFEQSKDQPTLTIRGGPDSASAVRVELAPASLRGVTPGRSTVAELDGAFGKSVETLGDAGSEIRVYANEQLGRIQAHIEKGHVQLLQIQLNEPAAPDDIAARLQLARVRTVDVLDPEGNALGRAFPELGVLMSFAPDSESPRVAQVIFETIDIQPFVLRAETDLHGPYQHNLADLEFALSRKPDYAYAHWLTAEIHFATGRLNRAQTAAERAVQLDGTTPAYGVTLARCLATHGRHELAVKQINALLARKDLTPVVRAQALVLLGDLIAAAPQRDMHQALKLHTQAIQLADPYAVAKQTAVRRAAKEVLVDAHLATARDIGWGNWRQRSESLPKWLDRASAFAEDLIASEQASTELRLRVAERALAAYSAITPPVEPSGWVREAHEAADALLAASDDPLLHQRVHWQLGMAYFHALALARAGGESDLALDLGHEAIAHLDQGARDRETTPEDDHIVGRLFFQIGAVHAVLRQDVDEAITWYERAAKRLTAPLPGSLLTDPRLHGDALVSMGVTFWEAGQRERALELTESGAEILSTAVNDGLLKDADLQVAHGNLSTMHAELGDNLAARRYAERVDAPAEDTQRR